jgi:hypothetical protein
MAKYQALTNLSIPMPVAGEEKRTFLVPRGETVELTAEQAENLQRNHRVPVIRPAKEGSKPMPVLTGRSLSGRLMVPVQKPPPGWTGARPDPAGSSQIIERQVPEMGDPQAGSESSDGDALDLPPGTRIGV